MNNILVCIVFFLFLFQSIKADTVDNDTLQINCPIIDFPIQDSTLFNSIPSTNFTSADTAIYDGIKPVQQLKFSYKQLIIPSALIAYGVFETAIEHNYLLYRQVKHEVTEHIDSKFTIDDVYPYYR